MVLLFSWTRPLTQTWSLLLEGPEKFSHSESRSNILNLLIKYYKLLAGGRDGSGNSGHPVWGLSRGLLLLKIFLGVERTSGS